MTRQQIVDTVRKMATKKDLLRLLNALKKEDLGVDCHPFTLSLLNYYCNPNRDPKKRYKHFTIPKKSGGVRDISVPVKGLKSMLTYLNMVLQAMYEPTDAAMGFVPGRSIADNAAVHVGKYYVFNTDLKDFFPSIHQARIWKVLQLKPFSLNKELASVIAGLCCMLDANGNGVLPQGSPCSPILTNIVCRQLDRRLSGVAKRFNLRYTRYADDITFSSDYNVFQEESEFMTEFKRIIADQNFIFNDKKTRLQKRNQRQEVTGLVVNDKVNVVREYVRDIRNLLYIWKRYGYEQAYAKFYPRYVNSKAYRPKNQGMPNMTSVIGGKLLYIKMVMGESSSTYLTLKDKFIALCPEQKAVLDTNLNYLASYRLDEFEKSFSTSVQFTYKQEGRITGRSKTMGFFMLDGEKQLVFVNIRCDRAIDGYLAAPNEKVLESIRKRLYISLAERGNDRFWLITIARMNNEHTGAFSGSYKAKIRENVDKDFQVLEKIDLADEVAQDDELMDVDACLSEFVSSGFDFKTLAKWDKIKTN